MATHRTRTRAPATGTSGTPRRRATSGALPPTPTPAAGAGPVVPTTSLPIETQVKAFADTVQTNAGSLTILAGLGASTDRRAVLRSMAHCPDALVKTMCTVASRHEGAILGLPYNSGEILSTLQYAQANEQLVAMLRNLADRIEEDRILRMLPITQATMGRMALLRAMYRKPEGAAWRSEYATLRATLPARIVKPKAVTPPAATTAPAAAASATVTVPTPSAAQTSGSNGGNGTGTTNH